jgi:hypothetical protein
MNLENNQVFLYNLICQLEHILIFVKFLLKRPQEVDQSIGTTLNEVGVTSSNPSSLFLCGHVKKNYFKIFSSENKSKPSRS